MSKPKKYDFSGWATKANLKCSDGRTILAHAFKDNDGNTVPLVWNHGHTDMKDVIGNAYLEHRDSGVYAYCSLNDTDEGKRAKELVKHGDIIALSIFANGLKQNDKKEVIHGNIREVSMVLAGANPGAKIDTVLVHSDEADPTEEARIEHGDYSEPLEMFKEEEQKPEENQNEGNKQEEQKPAEDPNLEHKDQEKTAQEIFDSMTEEQKQVVYLLVGAAASGQGAGKAEIKHNIFDSAEEGGHTDMKYNVFEGIKDKDGNELTHSAFNAIVEEAKTDGKSLSKALIEHGITGIENLMPDYQLVSGQPKTVDRDQTWVGILWNGVKHVPFQKIKSSFFDITADEARASGWLKTNDQAKVEETILAFQRTTDGQMIYKKQSIDHDDEIDITDFAVVAYLKEEMKGKWREEVARAILVGDGRDNLSKQKIKEDKIRPIAKDSDVYTMTRELGNASSTVADLAALLVDDSVCAMEDYKGSGNITAFVRRDIVSKMLLLKDLNQRRIYKNLDEVATAMLVNRIVPVPTNIMGDNLCVMIDLADYCVGSNPEGKAKMFDDFDIDFNKQKYLLEGKCSGANVTPYSAFVFKKSFN